MDKRVVHIWMMTAKGKQLGRTPVQIKTHQVFLDNWRALRSAQQPPMTKEALEKESGLSYTTIQRWDNAAIPGADLHSPKLDLLVLAAVYFGVGVHQLLQPNLGHSDGAAAKSAKTRATRKQ